ncbi:hypothetical protein ACFV5J_34455 [Streptomyces zaomyceticus]|uniref:hypothetical protein n=1 Tax=Streptomyces zaomyceticus TaxID=68286 RepID=UPI003660637E
MLHDVIPATETPLASSAGELFTAESPVEHLQAHHPRPDGDFVLTDKALYFTELVARSVQTHAIPLTAVRSWRQRSHRHNYLPRLLQRRIALIEVSLTNDETYVLEFGKTFARQDRKTGGIRKKRW